MMNHPGLNATDCPARITVTPHNGAAHSGGYACSVTGGHCLPSTKCDELRDEFIEDKMLDELSAEAQVDSWFDNR